MRVQVVINVDYDDATITTDKHEVQAMLGRGLDYWIGSGGLTQDWPLVVDRSEITVKLLDD